MLHLYVGISKSPTVVQLTRYRQLPADLPSSLVAEAPRPVAQVQGGGRFDWPPALEAGLRLLEPSFAALISAPILDAIKSLAWHDQENARAFERQGQISTCALAPTPSTRPIKSVNGEGPFPVHFGRCRPYETQYWS